MVSDTETIEVALCEKEKELEKQKDALRFLGSDYVAVYRANMDTDQCEIYGAIDNRRGEVREALTSCRDYQSTMETYISLFVEEKDKAYLRTVTAKDYVLAQFKNEKQFRVRYSVKENEWQVKNFELHFFSAEKEAEGNIVLFGFRNVDSFIQEKEEYKLKTMREMEDVLCGARIGIWSIEIEEGREPRLYGDKTMQMLLGVCEKISPEERYKFWFENIENEYVGMVQETVREIQQTGRSEVTYLWNHPTLGKIYVRCGGVSDNKEGMPWVCLKGYHQDITETMVTKQKQEKAILEALTEAKRANQAKSEFLSYMSHDIRTPINGILGMLAICEKNEGNLERQRECRNKIRVSAEHLLSLINDVLDISKMESGEFSLAREPFDLCDLLENCMTILRPQAEEQGITISEHTVNLQHTFLVGSPLHVRQILINIIGNAVKYNRPNGRIFICTEEVAAENDIAEYRFVIEDTGIGMGEEFKAHIFEPFTQESKDARTNFKGAGLGMAITKKLVDQMGGTITVESELDKGSTFTVTLPIRIGERQAGQKAEKKEELPVDISGMKVLLVEDNAINCEIVQYMLDDAGATVVVAENGKLAVDAFAQSGIGEYDCILMDVMMPVMNGLDAARTIRSLDRPDAETVPIIALSANAFEEDIRMAKEAGMDAHLSKPVDTDRMFRVMRELKNKI